MPGQQLLLRPSLAGGLLAVGLVLLAWADLITAALALTANLVGLCLAWFVTRVGGLPRDGSLRTERENELPRIAGRIGPIGDDR